MVSKVCKVTLLLYSTLTCPWYYNSIQSLLFVIYMMKGYFIFLKKVEKSEKNIEAQKVI